MRSFEDNRVLRQPLPPALLSTVRMTGEFKGSRTRGGKSEPGEER